MNRSHFPRKARRAALLGGLGAACLMGVAGCHSAFIQAAVVNHSGHPLRLIEVDYPSASFGTESLANGQTFKYRFKVLGSGATKLTWTDAREKDHASTGPDLHEGQEGSLTITVLDQNATWDATLRH